MISIPGKGVVGRMRRLLCSVRRLDERLERIQRALGRLEEHHSRANPYLDPRDHEYQVFSQWGEDGILQFLIRKIEIARPVFVEFGVEDYAEANTRFLAQNNGWCGLILDGSEKNIRRVKEDPVFWRCNLTAVAAFVDRSNINSLIQDHGISGDIGLLSVDIDGNDYWVWQAISCVSPRIVVCEYNSAFGPDRKVTTPYDRCFEQSRAHYSNLYYGASIAAFEHLGRQKGYVLVGSNSAGNNVFFVRADVVGDLRPLTAREAYVTARFRESRDARGRLSFLDRTAAQALLAALPLVDVETGAATTVGEMGIGRA